MSVRLIPAPIHLAFSMTTVDPEGFEREYHQLSESDDDPISAWLKRAKAKGDTSESDPVLLNLMVELHRKIDNLERLIKNEEPARLVLEADGVIESIGFHHFKLKAPLFKPKMRYYGRVEMPVHPKRDVGVFFIAENATLARIEKIHERDEKEWAAYLTARERVLIREMRGET